MGLQRNMSGIHGSIKLRKEVRELVRGSVCLGRLSRFLFHVTFRSYLLFRLQRRSTRFHGATSVGACLPDTLEWGNLMPLLSNYLFFLLLNSKLRFSIAVPRGSTLLLNIRLFLFFILTFLLLLLLLMLTFVYNCIFLFFLVLNVQLFETASVGIEISIGFTAGKFIRGS